MDIPGLLEDRPEPDDNEKEEAKKKEKERKGIWKIIYDFFRVQFKTVWEDYSDIWPRAIVKMFKFLGEKYSSAVDSDYAAHLGYYRNIGFLDDDDIDGIIKEKRMWGIFAPFYLIMVTAIMFFTWLKTKMAIMGSTYVQKLNRIHSPNAPNPREVMQALFVAPEKSDEIKDAMMRAGFSEKDIDLMILSNYRLYNEGIVRTLFFRGEIDKAKVYERMRELGFTDTRTDEMMKSWEVIPGMQDIVRYIGKEVFEPRMIEMFGLMEDYPIEAEQWAGKMGIAPRWAKAEWVAHWMPPGLTTILTGFHRGKMEWDEVDQYMKLVEIPPRFRELVRDVAYNPYTRVDTRRMHAMGVLNDEETYWAYRDQGYDHEHALGMLEWTIRYNTQGDKAATKAEILKAYHNHRITYETAKTMLIEIKYTDLSADWVLGIEEMKMQSELEDMILNNIEDRFTNNLITIEEARASLGKLNLPHEQVEALLDKWDLKRYLDRALHSKTDLGKLYINKLINEDSYRLEMRKLGYSFIQITRYIDLMNKTKKPA